MLSKPRNAILASLLFALVAGYFALGHLLYKVPVGLDESGFLAGDVMHRIGLFFVPEANNALSGVVLLLLTLLAIGAVAFLVVRAAVRNRVAAVDPGRRSFLTGAGAGAGVALGSMAVAGGMAAARGLLGVGQGGKGWLEINQHINDRSVAFTDPEWKSAWKGSRVANYRRFGRTDWNVSDIVLGTGRIKGEDGEKVARMAIDRGVNYVDTSPDYSAAGSEQAVGRAIRGKRDQLFIATKFCTPIGPPGSGNAGIRATWRPSRRASAASAPTTSTSATSTPATTSTV